MLKQATISSFNAFNVVIGRIKVGKNAFEKVNNLIWLEIRDEYFYGKICKMMLWKTGT